MPCHLDPDPHNHGRHPIAYNDHVKHPVDCADYHDHEQQPDQPVTVADLLDALGLNVRPFVHVDFPSHYLNATDDIRIAFVHVAQAIIGFRPVSDLSPEERAEYDRRTT